MNNIFIKTGQLHLMSTLKMIVEYIIYPIIIGRGPETLKCSLFKLFNTTYWLVPDLILPDIALLLWSQKKFEDPDR